MKKKLTLDNVLGKRAISFFNNYEFTKIHTDHDSKFILGSKRIRTCRFCNLSKPHVKFKKDAHVIPEFMGNRNLLSYFECDSCNDRFSKLETSFSNYLGAYRTFAQIKGKNKVPKFKDKNTGLDIKQGDTSIELHFIEDSEVFEIDNQKKELKVKTTRTYVPIHIVKIILKMGFSLLDDKDLPNYENLRLFLINDNNDIFFKDNGQLKVYGNLIPGPTYYMKPTIMLLSKREDSVLNELPFKQIILCYSNFVFQMILPFSKLDSKLLGKNISIPKFPLLIDYNYFEKYGFYKDFTQNFTSCEKVIKEDNTLKFNFETIIYNDPK